MRARERDWSRAGGARQNESGFASQDDGVEVQARTVEEAEQLLERAQTLQTSRKSPEEKNA